MFHHHRLLRTQSLVVATLLATALLIGSLWLQQVRLRQRLGGLATVKYDDDEIQTVHRGMDGVSVDYQAAPSTASMADEIGEDYIEAARVDANVDTGDSADDDEDDFRNRYDRLAASATNDDPFDGSMTATALQPHSPFAYLTLLSSDEFLLGTVVLVESLLLTGTPNDIIVMVLPHISGHTRNTLAQMGGVLVVEVDYIENPSPEAMMAASRQRWNFSKLRAWQMIEYEKLILLGIVVTRWRAGV